MKFDELANSKSLEKTVSALQAHRYDVLTVKTKEEALTLLKKLIPAQASVLNGSSVTLEEIGFVEYLKSGKHKWNNLHAAIVAEQDHDKQLELRKQAQLSDYYVGSVHALTEEGEYLVASNSGSQLPHIVFTSQNLIFVVSTKKIVPNMQRAMDRLTEFVVPLEDKHMQEKYGSGTQLSKIVIVKAESPHSTRKITFVLVAESVGF